MGAYGMAVGVAFQHADDLDDGDFPDFAEQAASRRVQLAEEAQGYLSHLGESASPQGVQLLRTFAQWIGRA